MKVDMDKQQTRRRIGAQLRELRMHQGLTFGDVAERACICKATVRNIEEGRYNVGIDELSAMAEAVGAEVNVEELFIRT